MRRAMRPIGYFVHHQGRGHAERCAALVNALPPDRPVTIFCARPGIFPALRAGVTIREIPSLFEARGDETAIAGDTTPEIMHCAPLGWPGIRRAMAEMAAWFRDADPVLMISDVSAEVAHLARLCSVPCVTVLQHGDRSDPGHRNAYAGAVGLLAPFHAALAQADWPDWMTAKTCYAPGLGVDAAMPSRAAARTRLGLPQDRRIVTIVSGGGGTGMPLAPLCIGARTYPDETWIAIGQVQPDWHATRPANLVETGWVDTAPEHVAAADLVVASTGNTTCQQILAAGKPWIAVPEWRYFDEQLEKARCLDAAGAAVLCPHLPSSAHAWRAAVDAAHARHAPERQRALVDPDAAAAAAGWIERLVAGIWGAAVTAETAGTAETAETAATAEVEESGASPEAAPDAPTPAPAVNPARRSLRHV